MHRVIKKHEYWLPNRDRVIVEVIDVGNPAYKDGIMYTFRCMKEDGEQLFAVENSHGRPHIHRKGRKEFVDYDWKAAFAAFDGMLKEHVKKIVEGRTW